MKKAITISIVFIWFVFVIFLIIRNFVKPDPVPVKVVRIITPMVIPADYKITGQPGKYVVTWIDTTACYNEYCLKMAGKKMMLEFPLKSGNDGIVCFADFDRIDSTGKIINKNISILKDSFECYEMIQKHLKQRKEHNL